MLLCLLVGPFAAIPAAEGAGWEERAKRVEGGLRPAGRSRTRWTIAERMARYRVPAVSLAVVYRGRIEWAKAYGVLDGASNRPADTGTLFQSASYGSQDSALW